MMPMLNMRFVLPDHVIDLNLVGTIMVTRAFLDPMIERNSGKIVTVASDAGPHW